MHLLSLHHVTLRSWAPATDHASTCPPSRPFFGHKPRHRPLSNSSLASRHRGARLWAATAMSPGDANAELLRAQQPRIVLGSASSSRRGIMDELAQECGIRYEVCTADIDEKAIRADDPTQLVLTLAHAKADAIRAELLEAGAHSGLLVTCDQVVLHEGQVLEKPEDEAEARRFIEGYGRAPAQTIGSVVVTCLDSGRTFEGVDVATIHFEPLPAGSVDALIEEGSVYWCSGGLMVEHQLVQPHVTKMEGTLDSVMGLPKALVLRLLGEALRSEG